MTISLGLKAEAEQRGDVTRASNKGKRRSSILHRLISLSWRALKKDCCPKRAA
jgi:hypothetical protein